MEKLGIDPILIGAQVVNFLLLLFILKKLLYKPILSMLDERKQRALQIEETQQSLKEAQAGLGKEKEQLVREAKVEADKLLQDARQVSEQVKKQIDHEAREKAAEMMAKSKKEIEAETQKIRENIKQEVSQVAVKVAEEILRDEITPEQRKHVLAESVRRFTNG